MNSIKDIFKKSFLEGYGSIEVDIKSLAIALLVTLLIGLYIFFAYRIITRKTFYSKSFNISLVAIALITSAIIVTIQSSVIVSLGMVGALSIVRFRTAVKDPLDLTFLFWSIATGIICGAGFAGFAVILALVMTAALLILDRIPIAKAPMILVVNSRDAQVEEDIMEKISAFAKHSKVKSRSITGSGLDLTIELRTDKGRELISELVKCESVVSADLLSHDGEVTF